MYTYKNCPFNPLFSRVLAFKLSLLLYLKNLNAIFVIKSAYFCNSNKDMLVMYVTLKKCKIFSNN